MYREKTYRYRSGLRCGSFEWERRVGLPVGSSELCVCVCVCVCESLILVSQSLSIVFRPSLCLHISISLWFSFSLALGTVCDSLSLPSFTSLEAGSLI